MSRLEPRAKRKHDSKLTILSLLLLGMIIVFEILSKGKAITPNNIRNILEQTTTVSLLAIGAATLMISGQIDLSLGGIGTFGALVTARLLLANIPFALALLVGLASGALFGLLNSFLVNYVNLPSFIVTIATANVAQGFGAMVCGGSQIRITNQALTVLGGGKMFNYFPYALIVSLALLFIYGIMLNRTTFGRSIYMVGENATAARLCGLNAKKISMILFVNAGCLATLAGVLVSGKLKFANASLITGSQFDGITASILGGVSMGGGTGGMFGALIGILILNVFENGTTLVGMNTYWQDIAAGLLLVVALLLDYLVTVRKQTE